MSDYQRFVSYIYEYSNGKKSRNAGFAKVESRNANCKIQIQVQNIPEEAGELQVYVIAREGEWLKGILLEQTIPHMPTTEIKIVTPSNEIGGDYSLENLSGLWIDSQYGGTYLSIWDDEPVDVKKLVTEIPGETSKNNTETAKAVQEDKGSREEDSKSEDLKKESEDTKNEVEDSVESNEVKTETLPKKEETEEEVNEQEADNVKAAEEQEQSSPIQAQEAAACPTPQSFRPNCRNCNSDIKQRWQCLSSRYSHVQPCADQDVVDCVRITPRDLGILRQSNWQLGRNSFLMQGYYHYHYLLFGMCKDGNYFLGVPGTCSDQERYTASMFGFPEFREGKDQKGSPSFGYWCRPVE